MDFLLYNSTLRSKIGKVLRISVADHLSRIFTERTNDLGGFSNYLLNEKQFSMSHAPLPWFAYVINCLAIGKIIAHSSIQDKDRFFSQVRHYY